MAVACTTMEVHDRRLSISKASASKISKPSSAIKVSALSASPSSSPHLSSPSPPQSNQLPSSITSSPSRPISKVVNADPSSFRRVVQELTGTTALPSTSNGHGAQAPQRAGLSRLQRVAPPPLRTAVRMLQDSHHHHQTLLEQMQQQQQQQAPRPMLLHQQEPAPLKQVGSHLPPPSVNTEFGNPNPVNPRHDISTALSGNPTTMNFTPSLPMLSPHLLSPLPALTPGDNTWANPIDAIMQLPKSSMATSAPSSALPPLLPLPIVSAGKALLVKPATQASNIGYGDAMPSSRPTASLMSTASAATSHGSLQKATNLPPLLPTPSAAWFLPQTAGPSLHHAVLPPWSPSPIPFSPGLFPPSPGLGPPPAPNSTNSDVTAQIKLSSSSFDPSMPPKNFIF